MCMQEALPVSLVNMYTSISIAKTLAPTCRAGNKNAQAESTAVIGKFFKTKSHRGG